MKDRSCALSLSCVRLTFSIVAITASALLLCRFVVGSDSDLPEMGEEVSEEKKMMLEEDLDCAIESMPDDLKMMLGECSGSSVAVHELNTGKIKHWKHGSEDDFNVWAFTPNATGEQLMECAVCIGIHPSFCDPKYLTDEERKRMFRHEVIHWTQYDYWQEVWCPNEDLFNVPYDGDGDAVGENGNPPAEGETPTPAQKADMKTRMLYDKFEKLRSEMTESEAILADVENGCTEDPIVGDHWLKPYKNKEDGPEFPPRLCDLADRLDDCMEELEAMIDEAKTKDGQNNKKLKEFAQKLDENLDTKKMEIEERKEAIDEAKAKYCEEEEG